ncbi:TPA: YSIRK-type signal peptide-containing protein, partial [Streptococcus suis]
MFWKEKQTKFSIRKFNLGVASVIIGMTGLLYTIPNEVFSAELPVLAQTNIAREQISYKYVLYSELTSDEKARIQAAIPARQVGNTHTYYMVYRPKVNLPQTGSTLPFASSFIGLGLLIIGISLTKDRKKRLVRSLIILTATGSFSVAAISTGSLSGFDKQFTLAVGEVLPQAVISIDQHEFVGFILEGDVNSETATVTEAVIDEQKSSSELTLPNTLVDEAVKRLEKPGSTSIEENLESPITEESPASNQSGSTPESSTSDEPASSTPEKESESSQSSSSTESNVPESPTTEESPVSDQSDSTTESSTSGEPASDTPNDSETPVTSASEV